MLNLNTMNKLTRPLWYQNLSFRIATALLAFGLLITFVFFGDALDNLLKFFGIKADAPQVMVGGDNPTTGFGFFDADPLDDTNRHSSNPADSFTIDASGNLTLNR